MYLIQCHGVGHQLQTQSHSYERRKNDCFGEVCYKLLFVPKKIRNFKIIQKKKITHTNFFSAFQPAMSMKYELLAQLDTSPKHFF